MRRILQLAADESPMTGVELALVGAVFFTGLIGTGSLIGWSFPLLLTHLAPIPIVTIAP